MPKLKVVPIDDIEIVPWELLAQIKGCTWTPTELVKLWPIYRNTPGNLLFVVVNDKHQIKGAIWCSFLLLTSTLAVNFVTMDQALQSYRHEVFKKVVDPHIRKVAKQVAAKRIWFTTSRPKAFQRMGYKPAPVTLMEV